MKLVLVHGRSQEGKDPAELKQTWLSALNEGMRAAGVTLPAGLEIELPFYGDTLDELVRELGTPLIADVAERGAQQDDKEAAFRAEFLAELAARADISDDDIRANYEGDYQERGLMNWEWVHAIVKTLDRSRRLGDIAIDRFTRDVYVYLTNSAVQRRINAIVAPHVSGEPCVVVGHSLGSVVAYNVLRETPNKVARYVTVGSPLAVRAVKNRLKPPLGMPRATTSWFNAMDQGDIVALYPLDAQNFPTNPPIINNTEVQNQTDNQHGIIGYLPNPFVANAIHTALRS